MYVYIFHIHTGRKYRCAVAHMCVALCVTRHCHPYVCDMTHSHGSLIRVTWHDDLYGSFIRVTWHDDLYGSFIRETWHDDFIWLIHTCDVAWLIRMAHSYMWRDMTHSYGSFICVTWRDLFVPCLIHMRDVTWLIHMAHSYVWHGMTHSYGSSIRVLWHDSFILLIHMCDMTWPMTLVTDISHIYHSHGEDILGRRRKADRKCTCDNDWFIMLILMTHSYVWHDVTHGSYLTYIPFSSRTDTGMPSAEETGGIAYTRVTWLILMTHSYVWHDVTHDSYLTCIPFSSWTDTGVRRRKAVSPMYAALPTASYASHGIWFMLNTYT